MIDINDLRQKNNEIVNGRFRLRLLKREQVPVVCDIPDMDEDVVVVDLPEAEGYEAMMVEAQISLNLALSERTLSTSEVEKENIPAGCELGGEMLNVTFLSIEKLDKLAAANKARLEDNGYEIASLERFAEFDLHLVPQLEAYELSNSLIQQKLFEAKPPFTVVVFSEGTGLQNILLFGLRQSQGILTTFQARYLGDYFSSISLLDRLSMQQRGFPLRETKCNCRYDVLRENILIEKNDDGQFIPATLVIDVEWNLEGVASINPKDKKNVKFNYLFPPPSKAAASLKFKPGWKDCRIALTDRINELRYLAELATNLTAGLSPWRKNELKEQPEVLGQLQQLVTGAKDKLDAQPVYPFDFTDRLWDVLKLAKSIGTLRASFQLIYDQLKTGEFRVLVEANKMSSLAKMLRMRNPDEIIFPRLEPMTCLQLLIEVGLDRFNGELSHRFLTGHFLPNASDLELFLTRPSAPIESKIEKLFPLYLSLQSMIIMEEHVRLPQHEKTNLAKRLLTHFTAMKGTEAFEKEFVYKVLMEDIRQEKFSETMSDWILRRDYSKFAQSTESHDFAKGSISDAVHIAKNFGIKYLRPPQKKQVRTMKKGNNNNLGTKPADETAIAANNTTRVKEEWMSPEPAMNGNGNMDGGGDDDGGAPHFGCIYLTTSSQPV